MRIFFSAGEASGDAYAAALAAKLHPAEMQGIGGPRLRAQTGDLVGDSSSWGAISIIQSIGVAPRVIRGYRAGKRALAEGVPGLLVAIDFGFMNIKLARFAKSKGWKVLYFVPPGSWRRDKQGKDLPQITDEIVTPFPWSEQILREMGANVHFFGHPIKELIAASGVTIPGERTRIAVLPGSRTHEIDRNLPLIADTILGRTQEPKGDTFPEKFEPLQATVEFAVAPSLDLEQIKASWEKLAPGRSDIFTAGDVYGVLSRARAAIVCSGTATLEAALLRCPMVVVYRITKAMAREAKLIGFKKPEFIALPNICLGSYAVPELAGEDIDPNAVRSELEQILIDGPARDRQLQAFEKVDTILGPSDAITCTADLALRMAR